MNRVVHWTLRVPCTDAKSAAQLTAWCGDLITVLSKRFKVYERSKPSMRKNIDFDGQIEYTASMRLTIDLDSKETGKVVAERPEQQAATIGFGLEDEVQKQT